MKKQILIGLFVLGSVLTVNAQTWIPGPDLIYTNGKVGVGIAPTYNLDVNGHFAIRQQSNNNNYLISGNDGGGVFFEQVADNSAQSQIRLQTRDSNQGAYTQFLIDGANSRFNFINGNVGIGTQSPVTKLSIYGDNIGLTIDASTTPRHGLMKYGYYSTGLVGSMIGTDNNISTWLGRFSGSIQSPTAIYQDLVIKENGNVGIGTTSPQDKLDLNSISYAYNQDGGLSIKANGGNANGIWQTRFALKSNSGGGPRAAIDFLTRDYNTGNIATNVEAISILPDGKIGIGTTDTKGYKLAVAGTLVAEEVTVKLQGQWPDFVFKKTYTPTPLSELEKYINQNGHLPNIPTEKDVKENGMNLGDMNAKLLQKIEELTIYSIEQEKNIEILKKEMQELKEAMKKLIEKTGK